MGIVLTEGRRIKQQFQTLVNPERPLSLGAASTNGLSDEQLAREPVFAEIADEVAEWLKGTVVVCHNAQFDIQFLDSEFRRLKREIQIPNLIDTLLLARQYYDLPLIACSRSPNPFTSPWPTCTGLLTMPTPTVSSSLP